MRILAPILLLIAAVATFFVYIDPQYQEIKKLREEGRQLTSTLENSNQVKAVRDKLTEESKRFTDDQLKKLEKIVPTRIDSMGFILDVVGIANNRGLTIESFKITPSSQANGLVKGKNIFTRSAKTASPVAVVNLSHVESKFDFKVTSSYEVFVSFLEDLERNLQITDISSITFGVEDNNLYKFQVSGKIYSLE